MHLCIWLQAQEFSYVNYNTRDGLAGSVVYCMLQDNDGFMWFGTESGLSRFDGTRFTNFTMADGLPDNEIIKLFADSKKRLWIVPFKNSLCYFLDGKIHTAQNDSLLKKLPINSAVVAVLEGRNGDIIIAQQARIAILKGNGNIAVIELFENMPFDITECGAGSSGWPTLGMRRRGKEDSLRYCELQNDHLVKVESVPDSASYTNLMLITPALYVRLGTQYFTAIDHKTRRQFSFSKPAGIIKLQLLNDSTIAISSNTVVTTYNFKQQKEEHIFFTNKNINGVMEDREGNLWFSSLGEGVYRLPSTEFKNLFLKCDRNTMPVISLKKVNNLLHIGTDRYTLWDFNTFTSELSSRKIRTGETQGRITTIDTLQKGLLLGTDNNLYLIQGNKTSIYPIGVTIKSVCISGNEIYVGTNIGTVMLYAHNLNHWNSEKCFFDQRTTVIYKQGDSLYIGALDGLYITNIKTDKAVPDRYLGNAQELFRSRITAIIEDKNGTLWFATYGKGVVGYKNGSIVNLINQNKGLTSNICRSIFLSDDALWIGTDKGLNKVKFAADSFSITKFTRADGLASEIINAVVVDKDTVYVGTPEGVTWFAESQVFTKSMCVLKVTSVHSDKKHWVSDFNHLQFEHFDNNIRFDFSGISFKSAGDIIYHYRLLGIEDNWRTTRDNFLTFPTLASGEYELQLQATNKFGVKSSIVSIQFEVAKLLWEKTWFRVLAIVLLGITIWLFLQRRIQRIRKQEALKLDINNRMAELEQMAFKSQMNPHFIFNSLNSIQQYVFDKDVHGANKFIIEFSKLIRMTLDLSSKTKINIREEVKYLSIYLQLEKRRFEDKFDFVIHVSDESLYDAYIPPMILQPYIENSIRHGVRYRDDNAGLIKVSFYEAAGYLVCAVEDNGVGREASRQFKGNMNIEYQSKGMTLTSKRIDMLNKRIDMPISISIEDMYDAEKRSLGTKVMIRFPVDEIEKPF